MTLLYGGTYIIAFGRMHHSYQAVSWAKEAQKGVTATFWNAWMLFAMPAVWLSWSIISYIACITAFLWGAGINGDVSLNNPHHRPLEFVAQIMASVILGFGGIYFPLIIRTLRKYGDYLDEKWEQDVEIRRKERE
ncbi:hypothetical protein M422DRAFT_107133, partial [Sphaerobolus stellatus SS14]